MTMAAEKRHLASRLVRRVSLQQALAASDGMGGQTVSWDELDQVFAEITPLRGQEQLIARQMTSSVSHRLTIRYRGDVTAGMRVAYGARAFHIRAVINPGEWNERLELLCDEGPGI